MIEQIVDRGQVTRGYIGVQTAGRVVGGRHEAPPSAKPKITGVPIAGVERDGPAEKAGVKAGDVLLAVNASRPRIPATMLDAVAELKPGSQANLKLRRDQTEVELQVTVGQAAAGPAAASGAGVESVIPASAGI